MKSTDLRRTTAETDPGALHGMKTTIGIPLDAPGKLNVFTSLRRPARGTEGCSSIDEHTRTLELCTPFKVSCASNSVALRCAIACSNGIVSSLELLGAFLGRAPSKQFSDLLFDFLSRHNGGAQSEKHGA